MPKFLLLGQGTAERNAESLADLQPLAGPAAGPNGGAILIGGFSGGEHWKCRFASPSEEIFTPRGQALRLPTVPIVNGSWHPLHPLGGLVGETLSAYPGN